MDTPLFTVLARAVKWQLGSFKTQELANTAWAFAKVSQSDEKLFAAFATKAERRVRGFNAQDLANTA